MDEFCPRRPELPRSLFVKLFSLRPRFTLRGALPSSLGPTGNSQAFLPVRQKGGKSAHSAHPCMLKSSGSGEKKTLRKLRSMCARASLMLITALSNDVFRPGKCLKTETRWKKKDKKACQLSGTLFIFTSVTIHSLPTNGIQVYTRRRGRIKCERFHLALCTWEE